MKRRSFFAACAAAILPAWLLPKAVPTCDSQLGQLEAVGLEADGMVRPINELSYRTVASWSQGRVVKGPRGLIYEFPFGDYELIHDGSRIDIKSGRIIYKMRFVKVS